MRTLLAAVLVVMSTLFLTAASAQANDQMGKSLEKLSSGFSIN